MNFALLPPPSELKTHAHGLANISTAVYVRGTSEDDICVQAITGLISDMLDRALDCKNFQERAKRILGKEKRHLE